MGGAGDATGMGADLGATWGSMTGGGVGGVVTPVPDGGPLMPESSIGVGITSGTVWSKVNPLVFGASNTSAL